MTGRTRFNVPQEVEQTMDFKDAFNRIAAERGMPAAALRAQIDAAIHRQYTGGDAAVREWFTMTFGDREPSLEELVAAVGEQANLKQEA